MAAWHSLSGLLYNKPTGAFSRFKSKKPQYYVFEESKCQLHFYRSKSEAAQPDKELGTISVKGAAISLYLEEPFSFIISSEGKEVILQAENHESMMIWLLALQANRDAFAAKELRPENQRIHKQLALSQKRRESAPDVSHSKSFESVLSRKSLTRMSTMAIGDSYQTGGHTPIEEEDEMNSDCNGFESVLDAGDESDQPPIDLGEYVNIEMTTGDLSLPVTYDKFSSGRLLSQSTSCYNMNGSVRAFDGSINTARSMESKLAGLSLSQSFTAGLSSGSGLGLGTPSTPQGRRGNDTDSESESDVFNYDQLLDDSPRRRANYASGVAALKPSSEDSGIDGRENRMQLSSLSDDSVLDKTDNHDPHHKVAELEQDLMRCKREMAELMNQDSCLRELLKKRDVMIAELDLKLSRSMRPNKSSTSLPFKNEEGLKEWIESKKSDVKGLEEQCRIYQNNNRFLNNELKKITNFRQQEQEKFRNQDRLFREQRLEIEKWKRDYLFLLQSCITIPSGDVSDGFELNVYGGDRHKERVKELLEEARTINPRLPTYESLTASACHVDSFGFRHSHKSESLLLHYICRQLNEHYTCLLDSYEEHQRRWKVFLTTNRCFRKTKDLKHLCRQGIPNVHRSAVWRELIHIQVKDIKAAKGQHYYTNLTQQIHDSEIAGIHRKQISLDLLRTLPTNIRFDSNEAEGVQKLQEILQAFCIHNPAVGYCQGMNFLAGMGLLFLSKEDTFWLLVALTECYFHPLYFCSSLIGAQADQLVLKDLVIEHLPTINQHVKELEIDISTVTLNWFLSIFFDAVPFQTLLRIWDVFLLEGPKVLFRFTIGILRLHEKVLLQQSDTISIWRHLKASAKLTFDVEGLMKSAFEDIPNFAHRKDINAKQNCYINALKEQDEIKRRKRKVFQDCEEKFRDYETKSSADRPVIECGACFGSNNVWICYGDQNMTRICKVNPAENLMSNMIEQVESRVMCLCALDNGIVLLGTLNMYIVAFDLENAERLWQCRIHDSVLDICTAVASEKGTNRVFAALADGSVAVVDHVGPEEPNSNIFYVNLGSSPLTSLLLVNTELWVACGNFVQLIDAETLDPKEKFHVSNNPFDTVLCLRRSRFGVWIAVRGSSVIELWNEDSLQCCLLFDVKDLKYPTFRKDDDTLFNPWRITAILPYDDCLWVGTGNGDLVVFTISVSSKAGSTSERPNRVALKRPNTLLATNATVQEKVERYLNEMDRSKLPKDVSEDSTPRASPYPSPMRRRISKMSRSSQTISSFKKQITVSKQHDPKVLDMRLQEEIANHDSFHLEIFLQVSGDDKNTEDKGTFTDLPLISDPPLRQNAIDTVSTDDDSEVFVEPTKQISSGSTPTNTSVGQSSVSGTDGFPGLETATASSHDGFASAEDTTTPESPRPLSAGPSPFPAMSNSSQLTALQPFHSIWKAQNGYDFNLLLTVRNKVSESPIKCLVLAPADNIKDDIIISCSSRFGEDEALLKWRRESLDQQIWTNEPIFEMHPITRAIQLPTYMRNRIGSAKNESSISRKGSNSCLTE